MNLAAWLAVAFAVACAGVARWRVGRSWAVIAVLLSLAAGAVVVVTDMQAWPWDALLAPVAVCLLVLAWPRHRRQADGWLLALGVLLIAGAGLELVARAALPPPMMPADAYQRFRYGPTWEQHACRAAYIDDHSDVLAQRVGPTPGDRPVTLHIGDSMLEARVRGQRQGAAEQIAAGDPRRQHINAGFAGTGPDFQLLLMAAWLDHTKASELVVWAYTGNDAADIDKPWACCDNGPVLRWTEPLPTPRCQQPRWNVPATARLANSPPPWPLRQLAGPLVTGRHLADVWVRAAAVLRPGLGAAQGAAASPVQWERLAAAYRAIAAEARRRGISPHAVVIPHRALVQAAASGALADNDPGKQAHARLLQAVQQAPMPAIDALPPLTAAYQRQGDALYTDREHLSPLGSRVLAETFRKASPQRSARASAIGDEPQNAP